MKKLFGAFLLIIFIFALSGVCAAEGSERITLDVPTIEPCYYSGQRQYPDVPSSPLYTVSAPYARCVGVYSVTLTLTDPDRYKWRGTDDASVTAEFEIRRSYNVFTEPIGVFDMSLDSSERFFAQSRFGYARFEYSDSQDGEYSSTAPTKEGTYYTRAVVDETEDYYGIVSEPVAFELFEPVASESERFNLTPWLFLLIGLLGIAALVLIIVASRSTVVTETSTAESSALPDMTEPDLYDEPQLILTLSEDIPICTSSLAVTPEHADELISDSLAGTFIRKYPDVGRTRTAMRESVSIGDISDSFDVGDRVDIKALKERGIVGEDAEAIRIVAKGSIDKPLRIFAADFDLCAVKMIALAGGEAYKTVSVRRKK